MCFEEILGRHERGLPDPGGGRGDAGDVGADAAALAGPVPGGRGGRLARPAGRPAIAAAGRCGRAGAGDGALCRAVRRVHREALPREAGGAPRLPARLHGDAAGAAGGGAGEARAPAWGAPHMHVDHAGNIKRFPDASVHLQDSEVAHVTGRCMHEDHLRHPYELADVLNIMRKNWGKQLAFHDGDCSRGRRCTFFPVTPPVSRPRGSGRRGARCCWRPTAATSI